MWNISTYNMEDMDIEDIEVYDGRTWTCQHKEIQQLFNDNPWLIQASAKSWCNQELLFSDLRKQELVHPLFFRFGPLGLGAHLIDNIRIFKDTQPETRLSGFLGKLRNDRPNVDAHLNNLNAYCYLQRREVTPQWEPPMPHNCPSNKRPDLGIPHEKGLIYTEVMTIGEAEADRCYSNAVLDLQARVNAIPGLVYDVLVAFSLGFQLNDIEEVFSFIQEKILSGSLPQSPDEEVKIEYGNIGRPIASIHFSKTNGRRGAWMMSGGPTKIRMDSRRAKRAILEKLKEECFQLPPKPALGGYIICLDATYMRPYDVQDAIIGNQGFAFSTVEGQSHTIRLQDGVIHDENGAKLVDVDFVVVVDRTHEEWRQKNMQIIMNTHALISREKVENIFLSPALCSGS